MNNCLNAYRNEDSGIKDAVNTLSANLKFSVLDKSLGTLVVTGSVHAEGKSTIALWLAMAMAESGQRTLIVDTDLRNPAIGKYLSLNARSGFLRLLFQETDWSGAAQPTSVENLWFLGTEHPVAAPIDILSSERFAAMVEGLKKEFDIIVFDTPPLSCFVDAAILSAKADATLFVVSRNKVRKNDARDALDQLKRAKANVVGAVVNFCEPKNSKYYGYYRNAKIKAGGNKSG